MFPTDFPEVLVDYHKNVSLKKIGEWLSLIGNLLKEKGVVKIEGERIAPSDNPYFLIRYEKLPRGEMSFKIELIWYPQQSGEGKGEILPPVTIE